MAEPDRCANRYRVVPSVMEWTQRGGSPRWAWLVAALLIQRDRQRWHHEMTRRGRELDADRGPVPGMPGWSYDRHGIGVCLDAPDGEQLDADFNDETGAVIDVWFFARRVESLKDSAHWICERRLWRWRPLADAIADGCDELVAAGGAAYVTEYKNTIVLAPELDAEARAVAAELSAPGAEERWLAALEPDGEAAYLASHRAWIRGQLRSSPRAGRYLELAIRDASSDETISLCTPFLERRDWAAGHAIELLRARPEVPPVPEVATLLRDASLADDHPFAPYQACAYLLERRLECELAIEHFDAWSRLRTVKGYDGNPMQPQFAILALRHLPHRAMRLVRGCLRSSSPICVQRMVAILAAIGQRWCRRELVAALEDPRPATQAYLADGLRLATGDVARRRADTAAAAPPPWLSAVGYTFDKVLHAKAGDQVTRGRIQWQELAASLRAAYPEDWSGSWSVPAS